MYSDNNIYDFRQGSFDSNLKNASLDYNDALYPHGNLMTYTNLVAPLYSTEPKINNHSSYVNVQTASNKADTFPLNDFDDSDEWDLDLEYIKSLFPLEAKKILALIEDELDKLEYAGSIIFDQYPDKNHLSLVIDTVYRKAADLDKENKELRAEIQSIEPRFGPLPCFGTDCGSDPPYGPGPVIPYPRPPYPPYGPGPCPGGYCAPRPYPCNGRYCPSPIPYYYDNGRPNWLRNMTEIMFYNEMQNRRRRYRNRRTW